MGSYIPSKFPRLCDFLVRLCVKLPPPSFPSIFFLLCKFAEIQRRKDMSSSNQQSIGTRSACINAGTLALVDVKIPMRDLATSFRARYLNSNLLLACPDVIVGILSKMDKGTLLQMDAKLPMETSETKMQLSVDGCKAPSETLYHTVDR